MSHFKPQIIGNPENSLKISQRPAELFNVDFKLLLQISEKKFIN